MNANFNIKANPRIRDLRKLAMLDARDMRILTTRIDQEFVKKERRLFASEGASGGGAWPSLSPDYRKAKQKRFPGRKILQRSGRLRKSLVNRGDPRHVATSTTKPRPTVSVGTRTRYAVYHAPGTRHNPRLPVRDPIQHTERQLRDYNRVSAEYFTKVKLPRLRRVLAAWGRVR